MLAELATVRTTSKPDAALAYARLGLPVFPLHTLIDGWCTCGEACLNPGKHAIGTPEYSWTTDKNLLARWWEWWPEANIGTPVGRSHGLFVLDIDQPYGMRSVRKLRVGRPVLRVRTGGGGEHWYYPYPPNAQMPLGQLAPGVMALHVSLPPSTTKGRYRWV